jgi:hypothetical protein
VFRFQASSDIENDDDKVNPNNANEETDVSLSLAAEEEESDEATKNDVDKNKSVDFKGDEMEKVDDLKVDEISKVGETAKVVEKEMLTVQPPTDEDNSSHVDTDSLEENSNSGEDKKRLKDDQTETETK